MLRYYERIFPAGRAQGKKRYQQAKRLLRDNPHGGHPFDGRGNIRELKIQRTPFSIIYTIDSDTIYVIDIRDQRGVRRVAGLGRFTRK